MDEIFKNFLNTWWGITIICVLSVVVFFTFSALFYRQFFKRFYDIVLSLTAIIVFSPLILLLLVIGAIAMKGNPIFVQERPGRINKKTGKEKIIKLLKFRTMTNEKDEEGNFLPDEKRLNKYGLWLRKTSCDELMSLFNIFKGDISIVGPRPQLVKDLWFMDDEIRRRHLVRPGLTGLAQVNGRNSIGWDEKFNYDLKYIEKISLLSDLKIILMTVVKVFKKSDINREGTASDLDYGDWLLLENKITKEDYDSIIQLQLTKLNEEKQSQQGGTTI